MRSVALLLVLLLASPASAGVDAPTWADFSCESRASETGVGDDCLCMPAAEGLTYRRKADSWDRHWAAEHAGEGNEWGAFVAVVLVALVAFWGGWTAADARSD